jgi:hypothetical protein
MATNDDEFAALIPAKQQQAKQPALVDDEFAALVPSKQPATPQGAFNTPTRPMEHSRVKSVLPKEEDIPVADVAKREDLFNVVQDYMTARVGKAGAMKKDETKEEYVNRFMSQMRTGAKSGNELSLAAELSYLNKASDEDRIKAQKAYQLFDNTASYFSSKGQKGIAPVLDVAKSIATAPSTYIGLGVGKLATTAATKAAAKVALGEMTKTQAAKSIAGKTLAVPATEAAFGATSNVYEQKIDLTATEATAKKLEQEIAKMDDPADKAHYTAQLKMLQDKVKAGVKGSDVALSALLGAALGSLESVGTVVGATKAAKKLGLTPKSFDEKMAASKAKQAAATPSTPAPAAPPVTPTSKVNTPLENIEFDMFEGRQLLNKEADETDLARMSVRTDMNKKAMEIAKNVWERVPDLQPRPDEKVSDSVMRVFKNISDIEDVALNDAMQQAGVSPEQFAQMMRVSVGDGARLMQQYSVMKKAADKMKQIDPAAAKEIDAMYGERSKIVGSFTSLWDGVLSVDRNLKGIMVSQLATTIRNGYSLGINVTMGAATEALESTLYRVGKTAAEVSTGKPITGSFKDGLKGVIRDATRTAYYLSNPELASDVTKAITSSNPFLYQKLVRSSAGEASTSGLWKPVEILNTLNVAQDAFARNALFAANVDKQLSRVGVDMYDVLANKKQIPFDVLNNATDSALEATFSKMPKQGVMFHAIKTAEQLGPIASVVVPFPRYMANAMEWTFKHSGGGLLTGAVDMANGSAMLRKGDEKGMRYITRGLENASKSAVGLGTMYALYKYREENQHTPWNEATTESGSSTDVRAMGPFAVLLAAADYSVKLEKGKIEDFKFKEFAEAVLGLKIPAGSAAVIVDRIAAGFSAGDVLAQKKWEATVGEVVGEYIGRATIPLNQLSAIVGAIDRDEALPRDSFNILRGEEGFMKSAQEKIESKLPVLKQNQPVSQQPLQSGPTRNESNLATMLTGINVKGKPTPIEEEINRLHIPYQSVYTSTGDKVIDAEAKKKVLPILNMFYEGMQSVYKTEPEDGQKLRLMSALGEAQRLAKEIAINEDIVAKAAVGKQMKDLGMAGDEVEQSRIFEVQFGKNSPAVRRLATQMYEKQSGKPLDKTKDYMIANEFAKAVKEIYSIK